MPIIADDSREQNIVSIFSARKTSKNHKVNLWSALDISDPYLSELIKNYHQAIGCSEAINGRRRGDIAIEIQRYKTYDPVELLAKLAIVESELGFRWEKADKQALHEQLMVQHFKKALIGFLEDVVL